MKMYPGVILIFDLQFDTHIYKKKGLRYVRSIVRKHTNFSNTWKGNNATSYSLKIKTKNSNFLESKILQNYHKVSILNYNSMIYMNHWFRLDDNLNGFYQHYCRDSFVNLMFYSVSKRPTQILVCLFLDHFL
jgi:hypothetical protein